MDAKKKDKLATAIIYILVGIVVLILAGILGDILITGIPSTFVLALFEF